MLIRVILSKMAWNRGDMKRKMANKLIADSMVIRWKDTASTREWARCSARNMKWTRDAAG